MKKSIFFLKHIIESINKIESFTKGISKSNFKKDELRQSAVMREIEIIGEAVKNLPIDFTVKYPHIEWSKIAGTRDKIIHNYFGVDNDIIWNIIKEDIPTLKKEISIIINEIKNKE